MNDPIKINARDCDITEVSKPMMKTFLEENHKQGYARASICYGLVKGGELVQLMSFGQPRYNKNYQYEIIRDCTKKGYSVRGGVSKLWRHFVENNKVKSCICYSYPHNDELFTDKYINNCGFKNYREAKPTKKLVYVGEYKGVKREFIQSIIERHGVDRLLQGSFGHDRTNEEILLDLGFVKKHEDGLEPQIDIYYPFGVVYEEEVEGSSTIKYCEYAGDFYKEYGEVEIELSGVCTENGKTATIKCIASNPTELRKYYNAATNGGEVSKFNVCSICGGVGRHEDGCKLKYNPCPICGGTMGSHKSTCPKAKKCPECGYSLQSRCHAKTCSHYKEPKKAAPCPECGQICHHSKDCSHYKPPKKCPICGAERSHLKTCPKYKAPKSCPICHTQRGHKKTCPNYKRSKRSEK